MSAWKKAWVILCHPWQCLWMHRHAIGKDQKLVGIVNGVPTIQLIKKVAMKYEEIIANATSRPWFDVDVGVNRLSSVVRDVEADDSLTKLAVNAHEIAMDTLIEAKTLLEADSESSVVGGDVWTCINRIDVVISLMKGGK